MVWFREFIFVSFTIDNQRNGLKTQAKALITFVIRPDTLYSVTLYPHFKYISGHCFYIFKNGTAMSMQLPTFQTFSMGQVNEAKNYH